MEYYTPIKKLGRDFSVLIWEDFLCVLIQEANKA